VDILRAIPCTHRSGSHAFCTIIINVAAPENSSEPVVVIEKVGFESIRSKNPALKIENTGGISATNITILIESPVNITNVTYKVGFSEMILQNSLLHKNVETPVNERWVEIKIPNLIRGDGGRIEITIEFEKSLKPSEYRVFSIYDQGSSEGKSTSAFTDYFFYLLIFIESSVGAFFVLYLSKKRKSKAVRGLLNNIVDIRRKLLDDPNTKTIFEYTWKWPMVPKKKLLLDGFIRKNNNSRQELMRKGFIDDATDFLKKQCITDPSDFLKVDNMIRKLDERASTVRQ
jgi:hypothetical protein